MRMSFMFKVPGSGGSEKRDFYDLVTDWPCAVHKKEEPGLW